MHRLYEVLLTEKLARSRSEAERLIKQGAVSIGGCDPKCSFFLTGKCTCRGWRKASKATEEIEFGLAVKVGNGNHRVLTRFDAVGFDVVKGVGRSQPEPEFVPRQSWFTKLRDHFVAAFT